MAPDDGDVTGPLATIDDDGNFVGYPLALVLLGLAFLRSDYGARSSLSDARCYIFFDHSASQSGAQTFRMVHNCRMRSPVLLQNIASCIRHPNRNLGKHVRQRPLALV